MNKAYSTDNENFCYQEPDEVLDALEGDGRLTEGEVYYEIDTEIVDLADCMIVADVLERAEEQLYDWVGEAAEDVFRVGKEATDELDALIKAWVAKHLAGANVWRCVGKSRELRVTAGDIAAFAR